MLTFLDLQARDLIIHVVQLLQALLPPGKRNKYSYSPLPNPVDINLPSPAPRDTPPPPSFERDQR